MEMLPGDCLSMLCFLLLLLLLLLLLMKLCCIFFLEQAGLSMALGAFLAGLLLAETEFSLQVESDIAPYRGLLLGLFFMTVGVLKKESFVRSIY
jgi:CPA2 family monovalent cation:H+ antiporter-2